jgi:predicted NUDIX family NTP pyrophosphohydrolase
MMVVFCFNKISMIKQSAGILLYRDRGQGIEVLLVHPGGPFWVRKDAGAWSIPKGEFLEEEDPYVAAKREFTEELGVPVPESETKALGSVQQSGSKIVFAWAVEADLDTDSIKSNMFDLEWPPKSGQLKQFPEIDRAGWFTLDVAQTRLVKGQVPLLQNLAEELGIELPPALPAEELIPSKRPPKSAKTNTRPPDAKESERTKEEGQTSLF